MKTITPILLFSVAASAAAQVQNSPADPYAINDMSVPASLLYPGTVPQQSMATPSRSWQEVREDVLKARRKGTPIEYSNYSGYEATISWRPFLPQPERSNKAYGDSQREYQASRSNGTPAAYSSLETYEMAQAYPGIRPH